MPTRADTRGSAPPLVGLWGVRVPHREPERIHPQTSAPMDHNFRACIEISLIFIDQRFVRCVKRDAAHDKRDASWKVRGITHDKRDVSLEVHRATLEICRVSQEMCGITLEMRGASLEICRATLEVRRVSLEIRGVSLEMRDTSLEVCRASWKVCTGRQDIGMCEREEARKKTGARGGIKG